MKRIFYLFLFFSFFFSSIANIVHGQCWGGNVFTGNHMSEAYVCPGDGNPDIVYFQNTGLPNASYIYVVTDPNGNILFDVDTYFYDFENVGTGNYQVWGISYTGNFSYQIGNNIYTDQFSNACSHVSRVKIDVFAYGVDGGTIASNQGADSIYVCLNDGIADYISFYQSNNSGAQYAYIITDQNDIIINTIDGNGFDFNAAYPSTCKVWGLSYTGQLTAYGGHNITTGTLASNCFELSENAITILKNATDGGQAYTSLGTYYLNLNTGDGLPDIYSFNSNTTSSADYVFVLTDANNTILSFLDGNTYDFEGAPAGTCRVWGFSYTGDITAQPGQWVFSPPFSTGCWTISTTAITITRENDGSAIPVDGGTVFGSLDSINLNTTINTCTGDDIADWVYFSNETTSPADYTYLITDTLHNLIAITDGNFDFEGTSSGTCYAYGLSYAGNLLVAPGDNILVAMLSSGNYDLSTNFVSIIKYAVDGADIAVADTDLLSFTLCPDDGVDDIYNFINDTQEDADYVYILTDTANLILTVVTDSTYNFEGTSTGSGTCYAYGVSYTGNLTANSGMSINGQLSDQCYEVSNNYIVFDKNGLDGGSVATADSTLLELTCPGDGNPDTIHFITNSTAFDYAYLITDSDNMILAVTSDPFFDFDGAGLGTCRVWGLAYAGELLAVAGMDAATENLSVGCFDLSDNFIEIARVDPDGGMVSILGTGDTTATYCVGDSISDIVLFNTSSTSNAFYIYVITDENNVILSQPGGNGFDFENSPAGVCRVWGVSYTGDYLVHEGDTITDIVLSTDCYDLSTNFIAVTRVMVDGGIVAGNGEAEATACVGDGVADLMTFTTSADTAGGYTYIITGEASTILGVLDGDTFDFEGAGTGVCLVFGLSYQGNLLAAEGMNIDDPLADGCFSLSGNHVTVNRGTATGSMVSFLDNPSPITYTSPGDDLPDVVDFTNDTDGAGLYAYLITDFGNNILAVTTGSSFDFEPAGEGVCRVWGVSYSGQLTATVGENATNSQLSDGCFSLSDNSLEVVRDVPEGGMVDTFGEIPVELCIGDGMMDFVAFISSENSQSNYIYIVVDTNNILQAGPDIFFDFELLPYMEEYRVYGVAYTGDFILTVGQSVDFDDISSNAWSLSSNYVQVLECEPSSEDCPCGNLAPRSEYAFEDFNKKQTATLLNSLVLAPNPASDFIRLNFPLNLDIQNSSLAVFDVHGKRIKTFHKQNMHRSLDVSDLMPGIYFLGVKINGQLEQLKFVKI